MNDYRIYTVTHNDILYTGRMYHERKEVAHWITIYSVVRDLEVLKQVGDNNFNNYYYFFLCVQYFDTQHPNAEPGNVVDFFNFVQPNGVLQLHLQTPQQLGWSVNPEREPMKVFTCNNNILYHHVCLY